MAQQIFPKLMVYCEWIMRLLVLNVLFIFFSLAGFILLGTAPAYTAMTYVLKKLMEGEDVRMIPTFYQRFKVEFIHSNKFGLIYGYVFVLLFINFLVIRGLPASLHTPALIVVFVVTLLFVCSSMYVFALYTNFQSTVWQLIKNSFIIAFAFLPRTMATLFAIVAIGIICMYQPILIVLLGFSSVCAVSLVNSQYCFKKIQIA